MAQPQSVIAGQRYIKYYKLSSDCTEWKVLSVSDMDEPIPHAQLVNCKDPFDMRTVSCAEIVEGGSFGLADEDTVRRLRGVRRLGGRPRDTLGYKPRLKRILSEINRAVRAYKQSRRQAWASSSPEAQP